jgi:hypothetical protein
MRFKYDVAFEKEYRFVGAIVYYNQLYRSLQHAGDLMLGYFGLEAQEGRLPRSLFILTSSMDEK